MQTLQIAPRDLEHFGLQLDALELLQQSVTRGYITTTEIARLVPKSITKNWMKVREFMDWLKNILSRAEVNIKVGEPPQVAPIAIPDVTVKEISENIERPLSENERLFLEAYTELHIILLGYANRSINDWDMARDLVQESFYRLWRAMSEGKKIDNVKSYLFWILKNKIIDIYRGNKKTPYYVGQLLGDGIDLPIPSSAQRQTLFGEVLWYVNLLPDEFKEVLIDRFVRGYSNEEIAERHGITTNLTAVRILRGIKKVREKLAHDQALA